MGEHRGGYTASVFDLTPYLDSLKTNELLIAVDNADQHVAPISADFTFMGGIYRNVKLITTQQQHFSMTEDGADGVFVRTSQVNIEKANVSVIARLRNDAAADKDCYVVNTLYAPDGKVVSTQRKRICLLAGQTIQNVMNLQQVKHPILWSPEHPNLYRVKTILIDAENIEIVCRSRWNQSWMYKSIISECVGVSLMLKRGFISMASLISLMECAVIRICAHTELR